MKYTVLGFNQEKLIEFKLDLQDALILQYIVDFINSARRIEIREKGVTYYLIDYEDVVEEFPILRKGDKTYKRDAIYRILMRMVKKNILYHKTHIFNNGTYSCYGINKEMYSQLISD